MSPVRFNCLVLAAGRAGTDPVAAAAGTSHKALVPVAGMGMLARVLTTLAHAPQIGRVALVAEADSPLAGMGSPGPGVPAPHFVPSADSPARSVLAALDVLEDWLPCLVVTGDHPLLSPAMIAAFAAALPADCDVAAALAPSRTVLAAYPESVRTLIRFSDGPFSGCNLFALNSARARDAVNFWTRVELQRKRPWKLIQGLDLLTLARFVTGQLSSRAAMRRLSGKLDLQAACVTLPFAEAAIDVDKPADLALVEGILSRAEAGLAPGAWNRGEVGADD